jgi:hypothetical protein
MEKNILDKYFDILDFVFYRIKESMKNNIDKEELLEGPVCISGLRNNK